jgi:hypothetical protein
VLSWAERSRSAVRTAFGNVVLAAPCFPGGCAGATWRRRHLCVVTLTAEPPAHCRLVSDHDLCEIVVCINFTSGAAVQARGRLWKSPWPANGSSSWPSSFVRPETVLPSRPCIVAVHGAQRRSRTASSPPAGFILDRSEHRATLMQDRARWLLMPAW